MKATDIKPGVVYAYRQNRHEPPRPIVFLAPVIGPWEAIAAEDSPEVTG